MYSKEEMDYTHDTLVDLLISCMRSGKIPFEKPKVGDWCIEISTINVDNNRDCCIGKLISIDGEGKYTTETVGRKIINWSNAELIKIPSKHIRKNKMPSFSRVSAE